MPDGDVQITLLLPKPLADRLDEVRWQERRSRRELLREIILEGVERREKKKGLDSKRQEGGVP